MNRNTFLIWALIFVLPVFVWLALPYIALLPSWVKGMWVLLSWAGVSLVIANKVVKP